MPRIRALPPRTRAARAVGGRGRCAGAPALARRRARARPPVRGPAVAEVRARRAALARALPRGELAATAERRRGGREPRPARARGGWADL